MKRLELIAFWPSRALDWELEVLSNDKNIRKPPKSLLTNRIVFYHRSGSLGGRLKDGDQHARCFLGSTLRVNTGEWEGMKAGLSRGNTELWYRLNSGLSQPCGWFWSWDDISELSRVGVGLYTAVSIISSLLLDTGCPRKRFYLERSSFLHLRQFPCRDQ